MALDTSLPAYLMFPIGVMHGYILNSMLKTWGKIYHDRKKIKKIFYEIEKNEFYPEIKKRTHWLITYFFVTINYFLAITHYWWAAYHFICSTYESEFYFYFMLWVNFGICLVGVILFPEKFPDEKEIIKEDKITIENKTTLETIKDILEKNKIILFVLTFIYLCNAHFLNYYFPIEIGLTSIKATLIRFSMVPIMIGLFILDVSNKNKIRKINEDLKESKDENKINKLGKKLQNISKYRVFSYTFFIAYSIILQLIFIWVRRDIHLINETASSEITKPLNDTANNKSVYYLFNFSSDNIFAK